MPYTLPGTFVNDSLAVPVSAGNLNLYTAAVTDLDVRASRLEGFSSGVADDATKIQTLLTAAALSGGGTVRGVPGTNYVISAALVIGSNTTLDMTGCTVTLASSQTTSGIMLVDTGHNALLTAQAWVAPTNITVRGGLWVRGSVPAGSGNTLHIIVLGGSSVVVEGLTITSSVGKYAILLQNIVDARVTNCAFSTASDGVHVQGPATRISVRDIRGTTGDDLIAIMPIDWTAYTWGNEGDISDVVVDTVLADGCATNAVKVLSGKSGATPLNCKSVKIRNITGTVASGGVAGIYIGDDTTQSNTSGGNLDDILIDGISLSVPSTQAIVTIPGNANSLAIPSVTLRNIFVRSNCSSVVSVTGKVTALTVSGIRGTVTAAPTAFIWVNQSAATAAVSRLVLFDVDFATTVLGGSFVRASLVTHTLSEVFISNATATLMANLLDVATTTNLRASNVRLISNNIAVNVRGSASLTSWMDGCQFDNQSWTIIATATHTVTVTSGSSTVTDTSIASGDAGKLIVGTGIPANSYVGTVTAATSFIMVNAAGVAVLATANGTSIVIGSQNAGKSMGVLIGLDKLTSKTRGDMAYNTNAGIAGGVGPSTYTGAAWLNLATSTTY